MNKKTRRDAHKHIANTIARLDRTLRQRRMKEENAQHDSDDNAGNTSDTSDELIRKAADDLLRTSFADDFDDSSDSQ